MDTEILPDCHRGNGTKTIRDANRPTSLSQSPSRSSARWRRRSQPQGKLDPEALVAKYVPEPEDSAYGDATVRQVMDMTIGVKYSENYTDPKAEVFDYARAGGMVPQPPVYTGPEDVLRIPRHLAEGGRARRRLHLQDLERRGAGVDRQARSWPIDGRPVVQQIWQKLGAENDAYFMVDSIGTESGGGGLNTTLRDLARFGEVIRNEGRFNGQQIIPAEAVADIEKGGDKEKFAKAGYKPCPRLVLSRHVVA